MKYRLWLEGGELHQVGNIAVGGGRDIIVAKVISDGGLDLSDLKNYLEKNTWIKVKVKNEEPYYIRSSEIKRFQQLE